MFSPVYTSEMRARKATSPSCFKNPEENTFQPIALFGFEQGENLFIDESSGTANTSRCWFSGSPDDRR